MKAQARVHGLKRSLVMQNEDYRALLETLERLRQEHRDLDAAINALENTGTADPLQIKRLKKTKLSLKDRIQLLEDQILPDIIA